MALFWLEVVSVARAYLDRKGRVRGYSVSVWALLLSRLVYACFVLAALGWPLALPIGWLRWAVEALWLAAAAAGTVLHRRSRSA